MFIIMVSTIMTLTTSPLDLLMHLKANIIPIKVDKNTCTFTEYDDVNCFTFIPT